MPDGRRRSREFWTDTMEAGPPNPPAHVHRLPPAVRLALIGLTAAVFCLLVAFLVVGIGLLQARDYIEGRGEQRDRENARLQEQIRQSICDLLDQLPEGGLLDRPRDQYKCGPGIPLEQLTPQELAQVQGGRAEIPLPSPSAPATRTPPPGLGSAAIPDPSRSQPAPEPPRTGPAPATEPEPTPPPAEPSPLVDLNPLTEQVCDALGVCL